jgi:hypothetical protein
MAFTDSHRSPQLQSWLRVAAILVADAQDGIRARLSALRLFARGRRESPADPCDSALRFDAIRPGGIDRSVRSTVSEDIKGDVLFVYMRVGLGRQARHGAGAGRRFLSGRSLLRPASTRREDAPR